MEKIKINPKSTPVEIFAAMLENNKVYQESVANSGDISPMIREETAQDGQQPYAAIVACSDSRAVPEHIFMAGIGELFTVRAAGNVISEEGRGSIEYAVGHLGVRLIIVMGHEHCGAVGAAMEQASERETGSLQGLISQIETAIGDTEDEHTALVLNIQNSIDQLLESETLAKKYRASEIDIRGVIYSLESGAIEPVGFDINHVD